MSNINYIGNVVIRTFKKNRYISTRSIHNNGTQKLFNILIRTLALSLDSIEYKKLVPSSFDIAYINSNDEYISLLHKELPIQVLFDSTNNDYKLYFKTYIEKSNLDYEKTAPRKGPILFVLKNNVEGKEGRELAWITAVAGVADAEDGDVHTYPIEEGEVQEISWQIKFGNPAAQELAQ